MLVMMGSDTGALFPFTEEEETSENSLDSVFFWWQVSWTKWEIEASSFARLSGMRRLRHWLTLHSSPLHLDAFPVPLRESQKKTQPNYYTYNFNKEFSRKIIWKKEEENVIKVYTGKLKTLNKIISNKVMFHSCSPSAIQ